VKKFLIFQKKYPKFIYKSYSLNLKPPKLSFEFFYSIPQDFSFVSKFEIQNLPRKSFDREILEDLVFHLGLVEMLNYWKATFSKEIEIEARKLDQREIKFFKTLIFKGMGEYFFQNRIPLSFAKKIKIKYQSGSEKAKKVKLFPKNAILPIGGGKDSIVLAELLKDAKMKLFGFTLNPQKNQLLTLNTLPLTKKIIIKREIDPGLLKLNQAGFLNGHVPFSALLAFLSLILAYIFEAKYIAFGFERSADDPNLKYQGVFINHQWSKSFEFERLFFVFSRKFLLKDIYPFSFLRPLFEIQIGKLFALFPKYHHIFLSCNKPFKINPKVQTWCKTCPKCLFTFVILYPFLGKEVFDIFGENLFEKKELLGLAKSFLDPRVPKPFECLGTKKEIHSAFFLAQKRWNEESSNKKLPYLLNYFKNNFFLGEKQEERMSKKLLFSLGKSNIPSKFLSYLAKKLCLRS